MLPVGHWLLPSDPLLLCLVASVHAGVKAPIVASTSTFTSTSSSTSIQRGQSTACDTNIAIDVHDAIVEQTAYERLQAALPTARPARHEGEQNCQQQSDGYLARVACRRWAPSDSCFRASAVSEHC